jgi:hypothetical protein
VRLKLIPVKTVILNFCYNIITFIIGMYGIFIMPCKLGLYLLRLITFPNVETDQNVLSYLLTVWVIIDWMVTIFILMVNFIYLRSYGGHLGPSGSGNIAGPIDSWGKMKGISE